jgi:ADP-ribosylglycohydrolase
MILNRAEYRSKLLGCWMGKNIGGTLGAPFEWRRQVNQVSFYTQELQGDPLPNDDLDIQLLWLVALEEQGVALDAHTLAEYWQMFVTPHWAEYGNAKINLRAGLPPPLSGTTNNPFKDSCGAFIRTEIWACISPGYPQQAARFAFEDAIIDHGNGEGTHAAVFTAALESAAFVVKDIRSLIEIGLSYIPENCGVAGAVRLAQECQRSGRTWQQARDQVLEKFRGSAFLNNLAHVSAEDQKKGFHTGKLGWDVPSNIGMLVIGLLYGEGDFAKTICTAVNCGEDTDCTGATAGSIFGILHGLEGIPEKWITPIGRGIKTACLNLGELGYFGNQLPADIDDLTNRTERVTEQVIRHHHLPLQLAEGKPTDVQGIQTEQWMGREVALELAVRTAGPTYRFDFFNVMVDYAGDPTVRNGEVRTIRLVVENRFKVMTRLNLRWLGADTWNIQPSRQGQFMLTTWSGAGNPAVVEFQLSTQDFCGPSERLVVELSLDGRAEVLLVPVVLLNGNLQGG